jgi:hypothetical protein
MGMYGYYVQVTPAQIEAIKASQLTVDHGTFRSGGNLVQAPSAQFLPVLPLALVAGLLIWAVWGQHVAERRRRRALALALLAVIGVSVLIEFRARRTPSVPIGVALPAEPLRIDKAWDGVDFLLTGRAEAGNPPLNNVVRGGKKTGKDLGYGPARYLTPQEVQEVSRALAAITREKLRERIDPKAMTREGVYCWFENEGEDGLEYFLSYYDEVRRYFQDAARKGHGMLLCVM